MSLRPAGASGSVETYPGGPRAPGGQASYADLADAAAEAYRVKRGKGTRT